MSAELCTHPDDERTVRVAHGYLGDRPRHTTEIMCFGCGATLGVVQRDPLSDPAMVAAIRRGVPHARWVVRVEDGSIMVTDTLAVTDVILHDEEGRG